MRIGRGWLGAGLLLSREYVFLTLIYTWGGCELREEKRRRDTASGLTVWSRRRGKKRFVCASNFVYLCATLPQGWIWRSGMRGGGLAYEESEGAIFTV